MDDSDDDGEFPVPKSSAKPEQKPKTDDSDDDKELNVPKSSAKPEQKRKI